MENREKLIKAIESLNERYKIGEIEDFCDNGDDLVVEIRINHILFYFTFSNGFCEDFDFCIKERINIQAIKNVQALILDELSSIDIGFLFADMYEPYSSSTLLFDIIDDLKKLENHLNHLTNMINHDLRFYDENEKLIKELSK